MSVIPINTVDEAVLLKNLRQFLIDHGIVRDPRVVGPLPPCWLEPRLGVPYPGQTEGLAPVERSSDAVMSIRYSTEIPSQPYEGFMTQPHVEIWIYTKTAPLAKDIHKSIKDLLHDQRNYSLNGLQVNESLLYRGLQPLSSGAQGFLYNSEYHFTLWSY